MSINIRIIYIASLLLFVVAVDGFTQVQLAEHGLQTELLSEFRPIGGIGNNIVHPRLNAVPNSPELALAPLNFARGTKNGLAPAPNPRTISNVGAGGTGASGQNAETDDPTASAWLYVFGQFVDHDLDLEETPLTSAPINIVVPPGDPFQAIIADQFDALRGGDRFFWLNQGFNQQLASAISNTTLGAIIKRNTDTTATLQQNVFIQKALGTNIHQHIIPPSHIDTHGRTPAF